METQRNTGAVKAGAHGRERESERERERERERNVSNVGAEGQTLYSKRGRDPGHCWKEHYTDRIDADDVRLHAAASSCSTIVKYPR
jgi:hypothetical protein